MGHHRLQVIPQVVGLKSEEVWGGGNKSLTRQKNAAAPPEKIGKKMSKIGALRQKKGGKKSKKEPASRMKVPTVLHDKPKKITKTAWFTLVERGDQSSDACLKRVGCAEERNPT